MLTGMSSVVRNGTQLGTLVNVFTFSPSHRSWCAADGLLFSRYTMYRIGVLKSKTVARAKLLNFPHKHFKHKPPIPIPYSQHNSEWSLRTPRYTENTSHWSQRTLTGTHPCQYNSLVLLPAFRHQSQLTLPPGFTGEWILQNNPMHQVHWSIVPSLHLSQSLPHSWHPIVSFYG